MTDNQTKQQILDAIEKSRPKSISPAVIAEKMQLKSKDKKQLAKWLHELVKEGQIIRLRDNTYAIGIEVDLVSGRLDVMRSGDGFVTSDDAKCVVFIPKDRMSVALPGDRVVARIDTSAGKSGHGESIGDIVRVTDRGRRQLAGTLKQAGAFYYVVPIDTAYKKDFYVPDTKGAVLGDRVIIEFESWDNKHINPEAQIVEVIGPSDNPSLDTITVVKHYEIPEVFSHAVLKEAETASVLLADPGERLDIRDKFVITIDPERARDFDDALSLEEQTDGTRILGVHIADVAHFIKKGGAMDKEAVLRGNSVYLPDKVIPMLPEQLSNGVCSLNPESDKLTFSVFMKVDQSGNILERSYSKTIMRSKKRLTYEQAFKMLSAGPVQSGNAAHGRKDPDEGADALTQLLKNLSQLAQQFRQARFGRWALDLDVPEHEIIINSAGIIEDVRKVENDLSHQLVEECMVAANEAVALELARNGYGVIYRTHNPPKPDKIENLQMQLKMLGLKCGDLSNRRNLAQLLKSVKNHPLGYHIKVAVLRSMSRAAYTSAVLNGHYGLAVKYYCHFTSPIRRYPDLVIHRQLASLLQDKKTNYLTAKAAGEPQRAKSDKGYPVEMLDTISLSCGRTEQRADEAERTITEIKKLRYLEQNSKGKKKKVFDAVVVTCRNFGMFVELIDLQIQGLVHISEVSRDFVRFNQHNESLQAGKVSYKVGTKIKVVVKSVNMENRKADFLIARSS